jgi:hypothetical protein
VTATEDNDKGDENDKSGDKESSNKTGFGAVSAVSRHTSYFMPSSGSSGQALTDAWVLAVDYDNDDDYSCQLEMDSGAGEHVCRTDFASHIPSTEPSRHTLYDVQGRKITGFGRRTVPLILRTTDGFLLNASITFELAGFEQNVISVARLGENGFETCFSKIGGVLRKTGSDREVPFRRHGRRFLLDYEHGMKDVKDGQKTYICASSSSSSSAGPQRHPVEVFFSQFPRAEAAAAPAPPEADPAAPAARAEPLMSDMDMSMDGLGYGDEIVKAPDDSVNVDLDGDDKNQQIAAPTPKKSPKAPSEEERGLDMRLIMRTLLRGVRSVSCKAKSDPHHKQPSDRTEHNEPVDYMFLSDDCKLWKDSVNAKLTVLVAVDEGSSYPMALVVHKKGRDPYAESALNYYLQTLGYDKTTVNSDNENSTKDLVTKVRGMGVGRKPEASPSFDPV